MDDTQSDEVFWGLSKYAMGRAPSKESHKGLWLEYHNGESEYHPIPADRFDKVAHHLVHESPNAHEIAFAAELGVAHDGDMQYAYQNVLKHTHPKDYYGSDRAKNFAQENLFQSEQE